MELIDRFVGDGPIFLLSASPHDIRALGNLQSEKIERVVNPGLDSETIELRTFEFPGLEIYGNLPEPDRLAPIRIVVSSPDWKIKYDLTVGSQATRIKEILGIPNNINGRELEYCGETECVTFFERDGSIEKIVFDYYTG